MPIIQKHHRDPGFVQVDSETVQDSSLSWKARGLLCYLLDKPQDWTVRLSALVNDTTDGRHATRTGIEELEQAGYIVREDCRDKDGQYDGLVWHIFERPEDSTGMGKPEIGKAEPTNTDSTHSTSTNVDGDEAPKKGRMGEGVAVPDDDDKEPWHKPYDLPTDTDSPHQALEDLRGLDSLQSECRYLTGLFDAFFGHNDHNRYKRYHGRLNKVRKQMGTEWTARALYEVKQMDEFHPTGTDRERRALPNRVLNYITKMADRQQVGEPEEGEPYDEEEVEEFVEHGYEADAFAKVARDKYQYFPDDE